MTGAAMSPDLTEEVTFAGKGATICGVDEAGRGPWAGPVVAAAVVLDRGCVPPGLDDSKKLTPRRRAALFVRGTGKRIGSSDSCWTPSPGETQTIVNKQLEAVQRIRESVAQWPEPE